MVKAHLKEIDLLKGIAILLVIMGHCFTDHPIDVKAGIPLWFINFVIVMQMPLFFMASGILFNTDILWNKLLKKKTVRIIVPYITFSILTIILRNIFCSFTNSSSPNAIDAIIALIGGGYYWFLYSLLLMMLFCRLLKKRIYLLVMMLLSVVLMMTVGFLQPLILKKTIHYIFFFILGVFFKDKYDMIYFRKSHTNAIVGVLLLFIYLVIEIPELGLYSIKILDYYISPLIGCFGVWFLCVSLSRLTYSFPILSHFGKYSLQYYLNHLLILLACYYGAKYAGCSSMIISCFLIFISAIIISWTMLQIEKRIFLLRFLCGLTTGKK